ncbi:MAG: hypothetical protein ACRESO_10565 [Gammaproteobacteria bacterium]
MAKQFVICINQGEYRASLEPRKLYEVKSDLKAKDHGLLRILDESGEDYLYPTSLFEPVKLSDIVVRKLVAAKRREYALNSLS